MDIELTKTCIKKSKALNDCINGNEILPLLVEYKQINHPRDLPYLELTSTTEANNHLVHIIELYKVDKKDQAIRIPFDPPKKIRTSGPNFENEEGELIEKTIEKEQNKKKSVKYILIEYAEEGKGNSQRRELSIIELIV